MLFLRSLLFNILFYIWTTFVVCLSLPGFILGRRYTITCSILWGHGTQFLLKYINGITYEIRGRHHIKKGPYIFACKHQSAWDTTMIEVIAPYSAIILKKELTWIPFFGWLLIRCGFIKIDRSKGKSTIPLMVGEGQKNIDKGISIFVFPEGTRRAVDAPPNYRYGIVAMYERLNTPVIPIALNAGYFWPRRRFIKNPGHIIVDILPPINPGLTKTKFLKALELSIETACKNIKPKETPL
ncbi:lysophospholipid acyltransferase family protein [Candidatus Nucleicultrix amoebiphila]|uniref:lysophospholipid acyltransferase family protein n=1 Tax=Candidatus Nucleicultrix amoebiphila TaxID=1509244 RepID=UPI000A269A0D|nr:lysophospholipid acyltransferase family protein [Candidatus Nucleicultrix amoebiphila]